MKKYSLAQMEAFVAICRLGTYRAAAELLHVTQPTISLRIAELEDALGVKLFEKSGRGVAPTGQGLTVRRYLEQSIGLLDQMDGMIQAEQPFHGLLRLGAIDALAMTCLPEVVAMLESSYPDLRVDLTIANSSALEAMLHDRELDIAFLGEPARSDTCWFELVGLFETAWLGPAGVLAPGRTLDPDTLYRSRVLTLRSPSRLHQIIRDWFHAEKAPLPTLSLCNDISVIARFVAQGQGMSVLPTCILQREIADGTVARYPTQYPLADLPLYIAGQPIPRTVRVGEVMRRMSETVVRSDYFRGEFKAGPLGR